MKIFESHAHLYFDDYASDLDDVLLRSRAVGVERIVNIGVDEATSRASLQLCENYPQFIAAVGWHPSECHTFSKKNLIEMLSHPGVRAIGEIGLDYHREPQPRHLQIQVFEEQVRIAIEHNLPIVVHNREAHADCLCILEAYHPKKVVFHCFSGDERFAERVLSNGWQMSFNGNITYKNSGYDPVIRAVPADAYMLETDCPYLTPLPYRGKRNAPFYLPLVIDYIANVRKISAEEVAEQTWRNGVAFFGE